MRERGRGGEETGDTASASAGDEAAAAGRCERRGVEFPTVGRRERARWLECRVGVADNAYYSLRSISAVRIVFLKNQTL